MKCSLNVAFLFSGGGWGLRFVFPCLFVSCVRVFAGGKKQSRTRTPRLV